MEKEIARIKTKAGGAQGYMYSLTALSSGEYPVMSWGHKLPTSNVELGFGDVWKFGETSSKSDRYSSSVKEAIGIGGVQENQLYFGNQVQIKVAEKIAIYGYFLNNGHLPPGNKIFR